MFTRIHCPREVSIPHKEPLFFFPSGYHREVKWKYLQCKCQVDEQKLYRVKVFFSSFFFMWSIFASDMCIQPLLSFLCFFKVYKRWTNLSIKLPAPSRDFHFLRSHVSSHSPIIFAKSCQKLHACNWLKTEFRHQNWTLFTSCYALPCDNELK